MNRKMIGRSTLNLVFAAAVAAGLATTACSSNGDNQVVGPPAKLTISTGDAIIATVGEQVGPFVVKVTDTAGITLPNVTVNFAASSGITLTGATATTDANGSAFVAGTLSHLAGARTVTATVDGISTPVVFHITSRADAASSFVASAGNNQTGPGGFPLDNGLEVTVTDQYGNPVSGVSISWSAAIGTLSTNSNHTDNTGRAIVTYAPPKGSQATVSASATINSTLVTVNFTETGT